MSKELDKPIAGAKLRNLISSDYFKKSVQNALPKHLSADRFIRVALTTMLRVPKLAECDQNSFLNALLSLSQFGLEPDGRNAHLIPFKNKSKGITECQLILDYKGLADLTMRSGLVSNIHADVVCENDDFDYDRGVIVRHRINFREPRGQAFAAYALVRFKDGTEKSEVMGKDEIYAVRDKSSGWRAYKSGYGQSPWADPQSEPEMWKKTAFRRCSKWLKLSPELADAIDIEDNQEVHMAREVKVEIVDPPAIEEAQEDEEWPSDAIPMEVVEPKPKKRKSKSTLVDEELNPQDELLLLLEKDGFGLDDYLRWGRETGNIEDAVADNITCMDDIPTDLATRHLRAKKSLLMALAAGKGAQ